MREDASEEQLSHGELHSTHTCFPSRLRPCHRHPYPRADSKAFQIAFDFQLRKRAWQLARWISGKLELSQRSFRKALQARGFSINAQLVRLK